jgi:hypothetical protein
MRDPADHGDAMLRVLSQGRRSPLYSGLPICVEGASSDAGHATFYVADNSCQPIGVSPRCVGPVRCINETAERNVDEGGSRQ